MANAPNIPHRFAQSFSSWRNVLDAAPVDARLAMFNNAVHEVASFVANGLDRVAAADELADIATSFALDIDATQTIISKEFEKIRPAANGHDKTAGATPTLRAKRYTLPDPATLPKRPWLYAGHYMRGIVTATVAPGGYGKTTLALYEALTMAMMGWRVWYISGEDALDEIHRRVAAHVQLHQVDKTKIEENLFVDDKMSFTFKIAKTEGNKRDVVAFDDTALVNFEGAIAADRIDVVVLDPLISFHTVTEGDNNGIDAVVKRLGEIAIRRFCDIELSHHVRKPQGAQDITVMDSRGAIALVNAVRSCRVINQMSKTVAEQCGIDLELRFRYLRLDNGKTNMMPPVKAKWFLLNNIEIANGDHVQALDAWPFPTPSQPTEDDVNWLRIMLRERAYRVSTQAEDWLGCIMAQHFGRDVDDRKDRGWLMKTIKQWEQDGIIKQIFQNDEKRKPRPYWTLARAKTTPARNDPDDPMFDYQCDQNGEPD